MDDEGLPPGPEGPPARDAPPGGARFTVASLLADLAAGGTGERSGAVEPPGRAEADDLASLLGWFAGECRALLDPVPGDALPLRLPKSRISSLLACERGTVAGLDDGTGGRALSEPLVRGRVTDLVVAQHISAGAVADPAAAVHEGLEAWGDTDVAAWLAEAPPEARARVEAHAAAVVARLATDWGPIDGAWWPRAQERVSVPMADGALVLSGIFDLSLGGGPTGRPWVVVEVKAGEAGDRNRADVLWYALLGALRHGAPPAVVATWTAADGGLVPVRIGLGSLEAAARRGLAALERLAGLAAGRPPTATPHRGCTWCPDLDRCDPGLAHVARGAGGPVGPGGPDAGWDTGVDLGQDGPRW